MDAFFSSLDKHLIVETNIDGLPRLRTPTFPFRTARFYPGFTFLGDLISPWKYSMIRKKNSIKTPTNLETWRATHINSLTRFRPDFHHVGGEIKSGCDYKKSLQVSKEGWPPIYFLCSHALKDDFTHFNFNYWVGRLWRLFFLSHHLLLHDGTFFFRLFFFHQKKRRIRFLWLWINEG